MTNDEKIVDGKEIRAHDMPRQVDWINAKLIWNTPVDLDLHAFVKLTNGDARHVYFGGERKNEFVSLDLGCGVGYVTDDPTRNEESMHCRRLAEIERILFATMRIGEEERFSDYHGRMEFTTNNPDQPTICVNMVSSESKDWCVIAMLDNCNSRGPRIFPINRVMSSEPDINDPMWLIIRNN